MKTIETKLNEIIRDQFTSNLEGERLTSTGTITHEEATFIMNLISERGLARCLETGVAFGASTIAICAALSKLAAAGKHCYHYGADPCQHSDYGGAAIAGLKECKLDDFFHLMEGPSHLTIPELIAKGIEIDFALIDGWHTFDYTLVDVFLADKLLRPGGVMLIHDMNMPSKKKVWRYLKSHRRYKKLLAPRRSLRRRILSSGNQAIHGHVRNAILTLSTRHPLLVIEKVSSWEPPHSFFRTF